MNIVPWCERYVKPASSGKSADFDCSLTPWLREPLENRNDGITRHNALIKPIQSGGSQLGECILLWTMAHSHRGDICAYWPTDTASDETWIKRTERTIRSCEPVMARLPVDRHKFQIGLIAFPSFNFIQRGAKTDRAVA